jgi:hypothetical protein
MSAGTYNMRMGQNRLSWRVSAAVAAAAMLLAAPGWCADDAPPPLPPAQPDASAKAAAASPAAAAPEGAAEAAEKPEPDARIEQKHVGRRVSEVVVTPAGFTYHYTMTHLDDQDPGRTLLQPHPELSVPRFFRIDF